jgi:hypothetical protein
MVDQFSMDDDPFTQSTPPNFVRQDLLIELVPSTSWGDNLRSRLPKGGWDRIRKNSYRLANYRCEICNDVGTRQGYNWPVECHEVWVYDDTNHVQTLDRLISLCPKCHLVKHIGRAQIIGKHDEAVAHMRKVNGWTTDQAKSHIREAFNIWQKRSQFPWTLNLDALSKYGVGLLDNHSA